MARRLNQAIGFDVSQGVGALKQIEAALAKYNQKLSDITSATQKHDKIAHENLLTITTQVKANEKLVQTFERTGKTWTLVGEQIVAANKNISSSYAELNRIWEESLERAKQVQESGAKHQLLQHKLQNQRRFAEQKTENERLEKLAQEHEADLQRIQDSGKKHQLLQHKLQNQRRFAQQKEENTRLENLAQEHEARMQRLAQTAVAVRVRNQLQQDKQFRTNQLGFTAPAFQRQIVGANGLDTGRTQASVLGRIQNPIEQAALASALATSHRAQVADIKAGLAQLRAGFVQTGEAGKKSGESVLLSWRSVLRLFAVQVLHQAISLLILNFRQAIDVATKFSISIGEIQTISQHSQLDYSVWASEIRKLSVELGNPAPDVAKAIYETLSNQVTEGAGAFAFARKEMKLAAVTVATVGQAVDATTSVLNAFNLDITETDRVNAVLFKTVDLGRVKLDEMASSLGRANVLSAQLNITYEEQQAALAALTIKGIKFNVAQTFYVNMLNSLLKPTDRMKELFQEWGVTSGEAAVQTFGFTGVLKKLYDEFQRGGDVGAEAAEVFNRLRALQGFAGITGKDGDFLGMTQALNEMKNAAPAFESAFESILQTPGKKFQIEMNKVQVEFLAFAEDFIAGIAVIQTPLGGLADTVITLAKTVAVLASAYATYKVVQFSVAGATALYNVALKTQIVLEKGLSALRTAGLFIQKAFLTVLGEIQLAYASGAVSATLFWGAATAGAAIVIAGLVAIAVAISNQANKERELAKERLQNTIDTADRIEEIDKQQRDKELQKYRDTTTEKTQVALQFVATVRVLNTQLIAFLDTEYKRLNKLFKKDAKSVTDILEDQIKELENRFKSLQKAAEDALDFARDVAAEDEDLAFQFKIEDLEPLQKAKAISEEKARLAELAREQFQAGDIAAAKETFKRVENLNKEHLQIVKKFRDDARKAEDKEEFGKGQKEGRNFIDNPKKAELDATRELARLEKERRDFAAEIKQLSEDAAFTKQEEARLAESQAKDLEENLKIFTDALAELDSFQVKGVDSPAKFEERLKAARDAATAAGITQREQTELFRHAEAQRRVIVQQTEAAIRDEKIKTATETINTLNKLAQENAAKQAALQTEINTSTISLRSTLSSDLTKVETAFKNDDKAFAAGAGDVTIGELQRLRALRERAFEEIRQIRDLLSKNDLRPEEIEKLALRLQTLQGQIISTNNAKEFTAELQAITLSFKALQEIIAKQKELEGKKIEGKTYDQQIRDMSAAVDEAVKVFGPLPGVVDKSTQAVEGLVAQIHNLIEARKQLQATPGAQVPAPALAFGGQVGYHAFGGPRGTDTKLAWLTPGERVLTRAENKMFFPILKALGQQPMYRAQGGPVTNVGDININVNGGDTSQQTVSAIGRELQRQIRRGLISL